MVSASVPGMSGCGNPSSQLPGVPESSPSHRSDLGAPFFMAKPRRDTPPRQQGQRTQDSLGSHSPGAALGVPGRLGSVLSGRCVLNRMKGGDVL